jgi:hypothetical protein
MRPTYSLEHAVICGFLDSELLNGHLNALLHVKRNFRLSLFEQTGTQVARLKTSEP